MIDLNPSHMTRAAAVEGIHAAVDASMRRDEARRAYVGASSIGATCERRVQYEYMGAPYDDGWREDPRMLRIFQRGHMVESMAALWLVDAGFRLTQSWNGRARGGFRAAGGEFAGHSDRVVTGGPLDLPYPFLWEHKCLGAKGWKNVAKRGVKKAEPAYADQIATYQAYMNLPAPTLFQATNADTMELHFEFVAFDKKRAQDASDRAVAIIEDTRAGALRPRCTDDPDFYKCRDCPFKGRCWG